MRKGIVIVTGAVLLLCQGGIWASVVMPADFFNESAFGRDLSAAELFAARWASPYSLSQKPADGIYVYKIFEKNAIDVAPHGDISRAVLLAYGSSYSDQISTGTGHLPALKGLCDQAVGINAGAHSSGFMPFVKDLGSWPQQMAITPIPEPGTVGVLSLSAGILFYRKRWPFSKRIITTA